MKRLTIPALAGAFAIVLVALLAYGLSTKSTSRSLDDEVAAGQRPVAPSLSLPLLGSATARSLVDYRGKVVLLNFWASWCTTCGPETPLLERTQLALQSHHAMVLGITYRDTSGDSLAFMQQHGMTYPSLRDVNGQLAQRYATIALPESFLIDRAGRIVAISRNAIDQQFATRAIRLATRS
jgi:cytochrome c biogenesis protein CcmG, thiol:disulfide interchange protein DsbE